MIYSIRGITSVKKYTILFELKNISLAWLIVISRYKVGMEECLEAKNLLIAALTRRGE